MLCSTDSKCHLMYNLFESYHNYVSNACLCMCILLVHEQKFVSFFSSPSSKKEFSFLFDCVEIANQNSFGIILWMFFFCMCRKMTQKFRIDQNVRLRGSNFFFDIRPPNTSSFCTKHEVETLEGYYTEFVVKETKQMREETYQLLLKTTTTITKE